MLTQLVDINRFVESGRRLVRDGTPRPGLSSYYSSRALITSQLPSGAASSEAPTPEPGTVWIYLPPGALAVAQDVIGDPPVEPCERPDRTLVGLLVGDRRDWAELFE